MRYIYVIALILFSGFYTFSQDVHKGDDDDKDKKNKKDDDRYKNDDDDNDGKKNYMEVNLQSSINFTVSQPTHFENKQTVNNAVKLKFKSKDSDCSVFAKISNYTTPNGADKNTIPIEIQMRSNDSKKTNYVNYGAVQLTYADKLLFRNSKDNSTNNFFFDVNLMPLGYDYPEGQYNFTILFTMTQP